jgi:hypothetical protein
VEEALAATWRFAGLHASDHGSLVRALLVDETGATRLETLQTPDRQAVSLVDIAPAGWDEREAFDLYCLPGPFQYTDATPIRWPSGRFTPG